MNRFVGAAVVVVPMVVTWLARGPVMAQAPSAAGKASTSSKTNARATRRTADGQPDLQGIWTNSTYTPLERPKNVNKEFFTIEEATEIIKQAAAREAEQTEPGTIDDVHYDFTQFALDRSQGGGVALNLRTSLIIEPSDGRLPPQTVEGQRRIAERTAERRRRGGQHDAAENEPLGARCLLMDRVGPPMLGGAYNNYYQILQTPGYVMILVEMLHDARVIPLDGRAHLPRSVRQWIGNSVGRWDGDTLVVETTNFTANTAFQNSSENMRLIERFTRVADDTIRYQFTVDDPATWTRPWTAEVPWRKATGPIVEHACHEGNYGLYNTLAGARAEEKRAAEAATKNTSAK